MAALGGTLVVLAGAALVGCSPVPPGDPGSTDAPPSAATQAPVPGLEPTASYLAQMDNLWKTMVASTYPDAARPQTRIVRYIAPDEWGPAMADCLTELGFPTELLPDGGVRSDEVAPEQREALQVASFTCAATYPVEEIYRTPLNEGQLNRLYDYLVGELTACLQARGFDVDATSAPTRQTFVESYGQPDSPASWSPYSAVEAADPSEQEWYDIQKACPQSPADLYD